jgi:hypothetical protein
MHQNEVTSPAAEAPTPKPEAKTIRVIATPSPSDQFKTSGGEAWRMQRERWDVTTEDGVCLIKATTNPLIQAAHVLVCSGRIEAHDLITLRFAGKDRDMLPPKEAGPLAEQGIWLKMQTAQNNLKAKMAREAQATTSTTSN